MNKKDLARAHEQVFEKGRGISEVARELGVARHILAYRLPPPRGNGDNYTRITPAMVKKAKDLRMKGATLNEVAAKLGVSLSGIRRRISDSRTVRKHGARDVDPIIVAMWDNGASKTAIAKYVGYTRQGVSYRLEWLEKRGRLKGERSRASSGNTEEPRV